VAYSHLDRPENNLLSRRSAASLSYLKHRLHAEWISLNPSAYQQSHDDPNVYAESDDPPDAHLRHAIRQAHQTGLKVMLKPHIWLENRQGGRWRGNIAMSDSSSWARWFDSYSAFILHYARLASAEKVDLLCIGTELSSASVGHPQAWRRLIEAVRTAYPGPLTYAANWRDEYDLIEFWDELDYIGINAYFPLSQTPNPTQAALRRNAEAVAEQIGLLASHFGKPVLLTEIGFKSSYGTSLRPWIWHRGNNSQAVDLMAQTRCYQAIFDAFWPRPWFGGMYWWRWYSDLRRGGARDSGFTPQHKPAEAVIRRWYSPSAQP
jgi:hypothetical protein